MNRMPVLIAAIVIGGFCNNTCAQLWKQYSDSAKSFYDQKKIDKAIEYFNKTKEELQKDSAETNTSARICNSLAVIYYNLGQYAKAEPFYTEVKNIREKTVGKEHPDYASSCRGLAILYESMGQYKKAELFYLEAIDIRERVLGKEHPDYASSCEDLAILYMYMGNYEKSEPLNLKSKQIREKVFGREHMYYVMSCDNLAVLYDKMGRYEIAESLYLEAKEIGEKVRGRENSGYATTCSNLANLYTAIGKYKMAEPLFWEAKNIKEKILGKAHPSYATSCDNLASLYVFMNQFEKAEPLHLEAMQIREKVLGKLHPYYGISCNNLSKLYYKMGQYEKAESFILEAMKINEGTVGKEHPIYAATCMNLAIMLMSQGHYEKAEPLYLEAKNIREKALGKEHPDYAQSCFSLANLYSDLGQYGKAESLISESRQIWAKVLGKDHSNYSASCLNLANVYSRMDQYEKAEPLYLEAKSIWEKNLDIEHHEYTQSCIGLANLNWRLNKPDKAGEFYARAFNSQMAELRKIFRFTSESEKQNYIKKNDIFEKYYHTFNTATNLSSQQGLAYNVCLAKRNVILFSSQQLRNIIYNSNDTGLQSKYTSWMSSREQLSFWHTKPVAKRSMYVKVLEEQANTLEKELTRMSSAFKIEQQRDDITWKSIQQNLESNEAAIEFKEFNYYDGRRSTDSTYYIALVLRKDKPEPVLVQLFEKRRLDSLLNYKKTSPGQQKINVLYSMQGKTGDQDAGKSLYDIIWMPLEGRLKGISKVYYAPAGSLYKIAFAALPVNNKEVLSDKYQLVQLNTTASVGDQVRPFVSASENIILYGGVQYDADSLSIRKAALQYNQNDVATRSLPGDLNREGISEFYYLKGSEQEVNQIEKLAAQNKYNAVVSIGMIATEESFKNLTGKKSPVVLHIATHGFFFPDPKNEKRDNLVSGADVFIQSDNPLIRSGLALAGANNAWKGKPVTGVEDGILTSYEVSNMYLPNTKLVVLSACETGLGDIQGSEGVYGLQRAFKMAGVQNLVMSLWRVDDKAASEFMLEFYKKLFAKQTISDAFYNAQTIMKNKYRNDPYKWAAWILVR